MIRLTGRFLGHTTDSLQSFQSFVTITGNGDNSLSSRWVKFASRGSINQAAAATRGGEID